MKKYKTLLIICLVIVIIAIISLVLIAKIAREVKRFEDYGMGKTMIIQINENEIIDYTDIDKERMGSGAPKPWFNMLPKEERVKLIDYMREKNLIIKPGKYKIKQTSYFDEVKKILKFEVKEE